MQLNHQQFSELQNSNQQYKKSPICLLAHNILLPANIGHLFRLADGLGVEKMYLTGETPVPPNRKIKKTSRSTENYVDFEYQSDPFILIQQLKNNGYSCISLEITNNSIDIKSFARTVSQQKICLILGSENTGVASEILELSDQIVHIPMYGNNSSLNVAMAASIAVYELLQRY